MHSIRKRRCLWALLINKIIFEKNKFTTVFKAQVSCFKTRNQVDLFLHQFKLLTIFHCYRYNSSSSLIHLRRRKSLQSHALTWLRRNYINVPFISFGWTGRAIVAFGVISFLPYIVQIKREASLDVFYDFTDERSLCHALRESVCSFGRIRPIYYSNRNKRNIHERIRLSSFSRMYPVISTCRLIRTADNLFRAMLTTCTNWLRTITSDHI